ncbi:MAG TPA: response regulator [Herpetosiphonaceae bacterium]|nr:response regulator [Herpetosiphonaceae bacterium]
MSAPNQPRVAVVDDNIDDRMVMEIILQEDLGFSTHDLPDNTWGEDLLPVLQRYVSTRLDVLLLDLKLPSLHGIQLIKKLRQFPSLANILVVAVTVETNPEQVDLARRSGFDGYIGKPLNARRFPQQIRRILAGEAVWEPI